MITKEKVRALSKKYRQQNVTIRRHLHQHPELSFQEFETAKYIRQQLKHLGIVHEAIGTTGTVALVKGDRKSSKTIALRADIDALPIKEESEVSYKSKNKGVMHACGHDVHTASLLGTIQILQELKAEWAGVVKCIFQPGEEVLPGGASILIEEGVLKNPSPALILAQHVEPPLEAGKIGIKSGHFMASADEIYLTVTGKGGHAAQPHRCINPILISAHLLTALQQVISRSAPPLVPSVLAFGKIFSHGGATNIIPDKVELQGTFRTFDEAWRSKAHEEIERLAWQLCDSMGAYCDINITRGYPFLRNEERLSNRVRQHIADYVGAENVVDLPARMGAEDFAFYAQKMPACLYRLGTKLPQVTGLHKANFDIDENALEIGAGLMAWLALQELDRLK